MAVQLPVKQPPLGSPGSIPGCSTTPPTPTRTGAAAGTSAPLPSLVGRGAAVLRERGRALSAVDWHDRAACKGQPDAMFFDATGDIAGRARPGVRLTRWYAKQFCARCPVARACHLYAE